MNKKGVIGTNMFSITWFMVFTITIVTSIVVVVLIFLGSGYDSKLIEANALYSHVEECFYKHSSEFFEESFKEEMFDTCRLNKESLNDHLILFRDESEGKEVFWGVRDYEIRCELNNPDVPVCVKGIINVEGKNYFMVVAANQEAERVVV